MSATLAQRALRRALDQVRYVSPVRPAAATGLVAAVYAQVERDFGMLAPPVALHSPAPGPLAASWIMLRETLVVQGQADRAAKEMVAAAVSVENACPYCVAVHNAALGGLDYGRDAAALAGDRIESMADPALADVARWARSSGKREAAARGIPPFPADQLAELAGVAVTFQYLNRMVTVFLAESPLPAAVPGPVAGGMMRVLGRMLRSASAGGPEPGASLALLPAAAQPDDLRWAAGSPVIADAFARAIAAIEAAGASAVPAPVRELVRGELAGWDGQPPGPSRSWAGDMVAGLPAADRPAGRLALLTAFAPYQVVPADIEAFRGGQPRDEELVALTSWASMAAARRVGAWLGEPATPARPDAPSNT
ncbi:MAG TPA: carboxymuconolactone decarboxylase family protein [Streptosporangiaceae bacterium]